MSQVSNDSKSSQDKKKLSGRARSTHTREHLTLAVSVLHAPSDYSRQTALLLEKRHPTTSDEVPVFCTAKGDSTSLYQKPPAISPSKLHAGWKAAKWQRDFGQQDLSRPGAEESLVRWPVQFSYVSRSQWDFKDRPCCISTVGCSHY